MTTGLSTCSTADLDEYCKLSAKSWILCGLQSTRPHGRTCAEHWQGRYGPKADFLQSTTLGDSLQRPCGLFKNIIRPKKALQEAFWRSSAFSAAYPGAVATSYSESFNAWRNMLTLGSGKSWQQYSVSSRSGPAHSPISSVDSNGLADSSLHEVNDTFPEHNLGEAERLWNASKPFQQALDRFNSTQRGFVGWIRPCEGGYTLVVPLTYIPVRV
jgi:hypothetical protein